MVNQDRTWAEINLKNIESNFFNLKKHSNSKIMCVVKADAYGHGLLQVAGTLARSGADYFGVATLSEAIKLRQSGLKTPILLLGYFEEKYALDLIENDITATVFEQETAVLLSTTAQKLNKICKIHIKIDTGMSRLGFLHENDLISEIKSINRLKNLEIEGIFTHFSVADDPNMKDYTYKQAKRFENLCDKVKNAGINIKLRHVSASSALIQYNDLSFDMVRTGISLFGYFPDEKIAKSLDLKPSMQLFSKIAQVKTIKKGSSISYGRTFKATKDMKIAIVSIGYADGYFRSNKNDAFMLVSGKKSPVLGSICMDMCIIDVSDVDNAKKGDVVTIFGTNELSASTVAKFSDTIVYEVLCAVSKRVSRIY